MKIQTVLAHACAILLLTLPLRAQQVSKDFIDMLKKQQEQIEAGKKLNERKIELAKLENELAEKLADAEKKAGEAQKMANENQSLAEKLQSDPQNKKLSGQASKSARSAERSAKAARKAEEQTEDLKKEIASLKEEITKNQSEAGMVSDQSTVSFAQPASAEPQPVQAPETMVGTSSQGTVNTVPAATSNGPANVMSPGMAQKVIETTYRSYPQQAGQPTIIINNIISPGYEKVNAPVGTPDKETAALSQQDRQDFEDFKAWKRQNQTNGRFNGNQNNPPQNRVREQDQIVDDNTPASSERISFRQRFGEKPARNSGLWVIPMVGVHASNFNADLSKGKADGRTGWNAGLDFRIHAKRFFIQPGAHYFSSSMRVSSEDSLADAPLLTGPRIHSLKVPVLLGLYLTRANKGFFKMNIKGGATGTYVIAVDKSNLAQFSKDNIEEYSYGLNAGLGLEFGLITLDISHEWGMSALFKENNTKNNVLRATVGLKL